MTYLWLKWLRFKLIDGGHFKENLPQWNPLHVQCKVFEVLAEELVMAIQKQLMILPPACNKQDLAENINSFLLLKQ